MTTKHYILGSDFMALLFAALGGWAFGEWQSSTSAGFFMAAALAGLGDIGVALRVIAVRADHINEL